MDGIFTHLEGLLKSPEEHDAAESDLDEAPLAELWSASSNERYIHAPQADYYEELLSRLEQGEILSSISALHSGAEGDELGLPDSDSVPQWHNPLDADQLASLYGDEGNV